MEVNAWIRLNLRKLSLPPRTTFDFGEAKESAEVKYLRNFGGRLLIC
jgi:hypothetical protein